ASRTPRVAALTPLAGMPVPNVPRDAICGIGPPHFTGATLVVSCGHSPRSAGVSPALPPMRLPAQRATDGAHLLPHGARNAVAVDHVLEFVDVARMRKGCFQANQPLRVERV